MKRGFSISYVPLILGLVAVIAMLALVSDRNVRTWAIVMGCTSVASVGYAAFQENRAGRAVGIARRRLGHAPFDELRREMDRARRHERPFALARIRLASGDGGPRRAGTGIADSPERRSTWRSTDRSWRDGRSLYVLLPETSADAARVAVQRAIAEHSENYGDWRVTSFPENGVTAGALFEQLGASAPRAEDLVKPDGTAPSSRELHRAPVPQTYEQVTRQDDSS